MTMADASAAPPSPDDASATLWRSATTQVRDTIKYIVAGFAAVGAIIVGTAPLAGLDTVSGGWWVVVIAGAVLAVGGIIGAVWKASDVLFPGVATLDQVQSARAGTELARLRDEVLNGQEGLFRQWGGTVDAFRSKRDYEYETLTSLDESDLAQTNQAAYDAARSNVVARIEQANAAAAIALAGAQYAVTRDLAMDRRRWIAAAAAAVALGVGLFTVAVSR